MNAAELAVKIAAHFESAGKLFPAKPDVYATEKFPLVVVWDDDAQVTRVIACCAADADQPAALLAAQDWAQEMQRSGQAPCGTVCSAASPTNVISEE